MITDHLHGIFYAAILIVFIPIAHFIFYPFVQLLNPVPSLQCHVAFVVERYAAHMPVKIMHIFLVSVSQLLTSILVVSQLLPPAPSLGLFSRPASTFGVKGGGSCGLFGPKRTCRHHHAHSLIVTYPVGDPGHWCTLAQATKSGLAKIVPMCHDDAPLRGQLELRQDAKGRIGRAVVNAQSMPFPPRP
jgi:hypothetical protein